MVPIPVIWRTSPIFVEIPAVVTVRPAPAPAPISDVSKSSCSLFVYPEPPSMISADLILPPAIVTFAVAPSQLLVPSLNNLTL